MFTKEAITLTPKVIEAIKKIAGEKKCSECKGEGWISTPDFDDSSKEDFIDKCRSCNGTGKIKGWEWEPEWNELALLNNEIVSIRQHWLTTDKIKACRVAGRNEKSITVMNGYPLYKPNCKDKLIPLLHWERIEEILEGMGYRIYVDGFYMGRDLKARKSAECKIYEYEEHLQGGVLLVKIEAKTRTEAVYAAVIELGKE